MNYLELGPTVDNDADRDVSSVDDSESAGSETGGEEEEEVEGRREAEGRKRGPQQAPLVAEFVPVKRQRLAVATPRPNAPLWDPVRQEVYGFDAAQRSKFLQVCSPIFEFLGESFWM